MMNELYKYFENVTFCAKLNVCSGFNCVKNGLEADANVLKLIWEMDEWQNQLELYDRIHELLPCGGSLGSEECEHQYDMTLTAYLFALSKCNMPLAVLGSRFVKDTPRCFWAWKMAKELRVRDECVITRATTVATMV